MRKLNKHLLSAMACAGVLATVGSATALYSSKPTEVKAESSSINNLIYSQKMTYGGLKVLPSTFTEDFPYRNGKPEGIVIHETATPGATAANEATYFRREWSNMYAYVHAFVDKTGVIQIHPTNRGVWGAGAIANERFIQVELCEESNTTDFARGVNNDAIYVANLLKQYGLTPSLADGTGSGTIWSHGAVSKYLGGTDHTDPVGYFSKFGYSMSQFFDLVKHYYYGSSQAPAVVSNNEKPGTTTNSGSPIAKVTYSSAIALWDKPNGKAIRYLPQGSSWRILGKANVNGQTWYNLGGNQWIPGAYVYVTGASSIPTINVSSSTSTTQTKSNTSSSTSTSTGNFVSERGVKKVNYVPGYGVMIWKNAGGTGALGRYLEHGTEWKVFGYEMVNGHKWYNLGGSQWIDASYLVDPSTPIAGEKTSSSSDNKSSDSAKSSTIEGATVVPFTAVGRVNYVPGYGIMIWRQPASGALGRYLPHGSRWKVFKKATLKNGSVWYNLGGDQWIDANYLVIE